MTSVQTELLEHLRWSVEARKHFADGKRPHGLHYWGMNDFLLQHGRFFDLPPVVPTMTEGVPQACFGNSAVRAILHKELRYVEGVALHYTDHRAFFPVHHGWNIDGDDLVHDSTWMNTGTAYFGVVFDAKKTNRLLAHGSTNLENWRENFKLFRKPFQT